MDHLIPATRTDLKLIRKEKKEEKRKKSTCHLDDFTVLTDQ